MERNQIAALVIGLLGAACALLLAAGPVYYLFQHGSGAFQRGTVDGVQAWDSQTEARLAEEAERERKIGDLGLYRRYTVVPFFEDSRNTLYRDRDFAMVEARLEAQWAKSDQYERFVYGRCIGDLVGLRADIMPPAMLPVLDDWVMTYPDSYRARLVRGRFYVKFAWYFRGDGWGNTVSGASAREFRRCLEAARADLEAAYTMFPEDPNASVELITVAMGLDQHRATQYECYEMAIAADPLNVMARYNLLAARVPKWGGSWEEVDAIAAEARQASSHFPMLGIVLRKADEEMVLRGPEYKAALKSLDLKRSWGETYVRQLQLTPDLPELEMHAAYYFSEAGDYAAAEPYFRKLGDAFYLGGLKYRDLLHYNNERGRTYAAVAWELPPGPERRRRAIEALEIAPDHFYTNYFYGTELQADGDYVTAARHFEISRRDLPGYAWPTYRLAEIAEKSGQRAEAARLAREVIELNPDEELRGLAQGIVNRNS